MNKELCKAAGIRAWRSFLQAIVAQIPAGFVVTPAMIQYFDISYIYIVLAILINAAIYACVSWATGVITGLPEAGNCVEMTDEEAIDFIDNHDELIDELAEYEEEDGDE